jgi:hypothetical protein
MQLTASTVSGYAEDILDIYKKLKQFKYKTASRKNSQIWFIIDFSQLIFAWSPFIPLKVLFPKS